MANALENIGVIKKDLSCLCIITDEIHSVFTSFEYQVLLPKGNELKSFLEKNLRGYLRKSFKVFTNPNYQVDKNSKIYKDAVTYIKNLISSLESQFPQNLKKSLIHGDLFKDNIFFKNNEVSGFIDFFFTCSDTIVYDLATLVNAWFLHYENFNENYFKIFFDQYCDSISWTNEEKESFNFYLKASAIRFFLTRIHDKNFNKDGEVDHKDPMEFFEILQFHEKNNLQDFF